MSKETNTLSFPITEMINPAKINMMIEWAKWRASELEKYPHLAQTGGLENNHLSQSSFVAALASGEWIPKLRLP